MAGIGLLPISTRTGNPVRLSADGYPTWLDIGVTIAWELVTAAPADITLPENTTMKAGDKYLEIGTVLVKVTSGPSAGKFAPFDSTQTDGRQTLTRGDVGLLDGTLKQYVANYYSSPQNTELSGLIIGGLVFRPRLKVGTAPQPLLADLQTALPLLQLTRVEV